MPTDAEPLDLGAIKKRDEEATNAPWWWDESDDTMRLHGTAWTYEAAGIEQNVNHQILKAPKRGTPYAEYWPNEADAAFIAAARSDVPALVAEVQRLHQEIDRLKGLNKIIPTGQTLEVAYGRLDAALAENDELHQEILRLKAGHAEAVAQSEDYRQRLSAVDKSWTALAKERDEALADAWSAREALHPDVPLAAWEEALLDEQARRVIAAERDVIEAARAWRKRIVDPPNVWADGEDFALVVAVDALTGLDRDNETPEGSDG